MGSKQIQESINILSDDFKKAIQLEDEIGRFNALDEFITNTTNANIPLKVKRRFIDRAKEHQNSSIDIALSKIR